VKFDKPLPIADIARWIDAEILGDTGGKASGINEIHKVGRGDITFVDVEKYFERALSSQASFVIIDKKLKDIPKDKTLLVVGNPFQAYETIVRKYRPFTPLSFDGISKEAQIHRSTVIEPGAVIAHQVVIGKNCHIQTHAILMPYTYIGDNVIVQPSAVLSSDAFYFKKTETGYTKWTSGGRVVLEDDVQIGSGCTINKGVSGDTVIGQGTKIDCLVHVGHGVVIGKNCLIAAQVGIGGKTIIGDNVTIYGQAGIIHNLIIGDGVTILAKSGVSKNLEAGGTYFGSPATDARSQYRQLATLRNLTNR
jgi:UDP-3-O-[3-hydroxymyristoyl] glucosamine N-acyltransferase